ncbi:rhodanese-like domain-containing protein [Bacillus sp. FJAT-29814]|uniref:rhodanese-like domain-containing protein n=1 Tax=Bacillus sp. FJAT-29814 TaxID=1729688 RepID=UPI000833A1E6|nr:rhodanese-like domain-containing protein [Bacillus sp. FJAT-29814]
MKKTSMVLALLMLLMVGACGNAGYKNVSQEEAKKLIDKKEVTVLDVRTPEEFQQGHIPGATLIPVQILDGSLDELDKDTAYLVVCRSGNRSVQASDILTNNGFTQVYNMTGGMNTWTYELEQ